MLDWLMCRPIFADTDTVMSENKYRRIFRQCRNTNCRSHIVAEYKESADHGDHSAVQRHPVGDGGHGQLTYSGLQEGTGEIAAREVAL